MSFPFGRKQTPVPAAAKIPLIEPDGSRILGFWPDTTDPVFAPPGHSLMYSANGGGKTTRGLMPWLFSLLASPDRPAILILDSKDGEVAAQCAPMLEKLGVPTTVIDEMGVLPQGIYGRTTLNPLDAVSWTHRYAPEDMVFANDMVTQTMIPEPERDEKNRYWRAWPRDIIEFVIWVLLTRNPALATPGAVAALVASPVKLQRFAEIEAAEGEGRLQSLAENILGMIGHEHWYQHLQAAQDVLKIFGVGTRLHLAGHEAPFSTETLIRKRAVVFLCGAQAHMGSVGIYYGLVLMAFIRAAYLKAGPLWIGADEFTNAPTKKLVEALTTLRSYGVTVSMIAQSRSEIERKLGKQELLTIEENAITKQFLGFSSFEEAERVSKAVGEEHAISRNLSADMDAFKLQNALNLIKQRHYSAAELMAMPRHRQLVHFKGIGFVELDTICQSNIAPYCDLIADNPQEGGRLRSDPKIRLPLPRETL